MPDRSRRSPARAWQPIFLRALGEGLSVTQAAGRAGMSRRGVYHAREANAEFARAWDDAWEQGTDTLEAEAWRRARDGTERPIMYRGEQVASVREFSDTLMLALLRARRPEAYSENATVRQEHTDRPSDEKLAAARQVEPDTEAAILRLIDGGRA